MSKKTSLSHTYICQTEYHLLLAVLSAIVHHRKDGYHSLIVTYDRVSDVVAENISRSFAFINCIIIERECVDFSAVSKQYMQQQLYKRPHKTASWLLSRHPNFVKYLRTNILSNTVFLFKFVGVLFFYLIDAISHNTVEIIEDGLETYERVSPRSQYRKIYRFVHFPKNILQVCIARVLDSRLGFVLFYKLRPYISKEILIKLERIRTSPWWLLRVHKIHLGRDCMHRVHHALRDKITHFDLRNRMETCSAQDREKVLGAFLDRSMSAKLRASLINASGLLVTQNFPWHAHSSLVIPIFQKILHKYFSPHDLILVKPHPDKHIGWQKVFISHSNVEILESSFPLEIINWYPTTIQKAVAIKSTALRNLYAIPHKIEVWSKRDSPKKEKDFKRLLKYLGR